MLYHHILCDQYTIFHSDVYLANRVLDVHVYPLYPAKGVTHQRLSNTVAISNNLNHYVDRTLSHEIGHAHFGLLQPDDYFPLGTITLPHDQTSLINKDKYNIMNSGLIYSQTTHDITKYRWRSYQWDLIYDNF